MKEAAARFGRPVAAKAMGLESAAVPAGWMEKVKLAELPERIVWVALPVGETVKSASDVPPPPTPTPTIVVVEVLGAKFVSPL